MISFFLTIFMVFLYVCVCAQPRLTLCNPMDCNPPGSSVHEILQAKILEHVAIFTPGDIPNPGIKLVSLVSPALAGRFSITASSGKHHILIHANKDDFL